MPSDGRFRSCLLQGDVPVIKLCLALAGAVVAQAGPDIAGGRRLLGCSIRDEDKVDCGVPGIKEQACKDQGCCYKQAPPDGTPWCYRAQIAPIAATCVHGTGQESDCGDADIDEDACKSKGCCYAAPSNAEPTAKCFRPHQPVVLGAEPAKPAKCSMPDAQRIDCGYGGITSAQCEAKNCCYYHTTTLKTAPFCYYKMGDQPPMATEDVKQCAMLDAARVDCGFAGVTPSECEDKGCCYRHSDTPGAPFCYYKLDKAPSSAVKIEKECTMLDDERVDCGAPGITPDDCEEKGCCYGHSTSPGAPYCYYHASSQTRAPPKVLPECTMDDAMRVDCGYKGVTPADCQDKGCCYVHANTAGAPFCFFKLNGAVSGTTALPTTKLLPTFTAPPLAGSSPAATAAPPTSLPAPGPFGLGTRAPPFLHTGQAREDPHTGGGAGLLGSHDDNVLLIAVLGAAAAAPVLLAAYCLCFRAAGAPAPRREEKRGSAPLYDPVSQYHSPSTKVTRLDPRSDTYQAYEKDFMDKWDTTAWPSANGRAVPQPRIADIYEIEAETHLCFYKAKQKEIERQPGKKYGHSAGNEKNRFHGARMKCSFHGTPCQDGMCSVCRIVELGDFSPDSIEGEIHFRAGSHAAKGQGLARGKTPPPSSLDHFVHRDAGNAVFVAGVLLGSPCFIRQRTNGPLPAGTHSRVADKSTGVDEIVIFDTAQAIPKALIVFR